MHLILMLTGEYTEEQFQAAAHHLDDLRKQNPDMGLNMFMGPNDGVGWLSKDFTAKRLMKLGYSVKQIPVQDFITWNINSVSSTVN